MCRTCGCSDPNLVHDHAHEHAHGHTHEHDGHAHGHTHEHDGHGESHESGATTTLRIERALLEKNQRLANGNRAWLAARSSVALNLMGSPGAGKTALLEGILRRASDLSILVVEGDQATERDAERIRKAGCTAIQINTGTGCHLDAHAVGHGLEALAPTEGSLIFLENVGNLVCPALFDLGESTRIVVLSVAEGDDKPLKYPHMFRSCDVLILNKIDLLPFVDFSVERAQGYAEALNPKLRTFAVSATRGDGLDALCEWLRSMPTGTATSFGGHTDERAADGGAER